MRRSLILGSVLFGLVVPGVACKSGGETKEQPAGTTETVAECSCPGDAGCACGHCAEGGSCTCEH